MLYLSTAQKVWAARAQQPASWAPALRMTESGWQAWFGGELPQAALANIVNALFQPNQRE